MNIWQSLPTPFSVLAPMDDVTDTVFRQMLAKTARPDMYFTEFVNVDGLSSEGRERLISKLQFEKSEHPIIAQIWGSTTINFEKITKEIVDMGFDGVDVNMGCPVKVITHAGGGSALIGKQETVKDIITAVKSGADGKIPVSVKTRIGKSTIDTENWISFLLAQKVDAITVHGRTAKEMSKVPCHWDEIGKSVKLRNEISPDTKIIGNGDVANWNEALEKVSEYHVDGVMIGRGIFHDLYAFDKTTNIHPKGLENLPLLLEHLDLYEKTWNGLHHFPILKKFFKIYASGFDGAAEFREKLMETTSVATAKDIVHQYITS